VANLKPNIRTISEYNKKSLAFGIPGLLMQIGCPLLTMAVRGAWVGAALAIGTLVGFILVIVGLCYYAAAKGHSAVLGVLGIFSCLGLLILAALPDKTNTNQS
jgi:hypothetical protein